MIDDTAKSLEEDPQCYTCGRSIMGRFAADVVQLNCESCMDDYHRRVRRDRAESNR